MKSFVLGVLVCAVIGLLLRIFFFRQRWQFPEFMFLLMSISLSTGIIFKLNAEKINALEDVVALLFVCTLPLMIILSGAWWGQFAAERLRVPGTRMRLVLMTTGYCLVVGVLAFPFACLATYHMLAFKEIDAFIVTWTLTGLMLPGVIVEFACRARQRQMPLRKQRHAPPPEKQPSNAPEAPEAHQGE